MNAPRIIGLGVLLAAVGLAAARGPEKVPQVSEKEFRQASSRLLEDPLNPSADEQAKTIVRFVVQSPKVLIVFREEDQKWLGGKGDKQRGLLMAAYAAGNAASQLNSGVKRNDRYAGLLTLFRVYRALRERDAKIKNPEVEKLLDLQRADKLLKYVQQLEEKSPTKLSPEEEKALEKARKKAPGEKGSAP
jgi:hypothetical protein